jgi:hypothetical protein
MLLKDFSNFCKKTTNIVTGDLILFEESVYSGSYSKPKWIGTRWIKAFVKKDSYGSKCGQHTFTLDIIESEGIESENIGNTLLRKGRNLYKNCYIIEDALYKDALTKEKNKRSNIAKERKYSRMYQEAIFEGKTFKLDKIPEKYKQENLL